MVRIRVCDGSNSGMGEREDAGGRVQIPVAFDQPMKELWLHLIDTGSHRNTVNQSLDFGISTSETLVMVQNTDLRN